MNDRLARGIGLAKKAGALVCGTELVIGALRKQKIRLVLAAADISPGTRKRIRDKCAFYGTPLAEIGLTMAELSGAAGLIRQTAAAGVADRAFFPVWLILPARIKLTEIMDDSCAVGEANTVKFSIFKHGVYIPFDDAP